MSGKNLGIIKTPLQLAKEQLQKSQMKDQLKYEMEERMDMDELRQHEQIYKTPLQVAKEQLQKSQIKDTMNHSLSSRTSVVDLQNAGIFFLVFDICIYVYINVCIHIWLILLLLLLLLLYIAITTLEK
ncbi:hypothetical protein RFI_20053 [Reticulomyxa filosa]|uniref:Uncharacterized protein n=1 Tax=Reticulomyxa filosa TaxID=46433 RepID=X6MUY7_RETFI|nr:hypothetical protein RFI_20053 [Reticulomyxa filosa]|eukprot:ETO17277.1 hypothetical protein RFI_20053 [Reticulomyxa filosa]